MANSNILIGHKNAVDTATLSAGSWGGTLDNLKVRNPKQQAVTTDVTAASTKVRFALASPIHLALVGLWNVNATVDVTHRTTLWTDNTFTTSFYDSGVVEQYPAGTVPYSAIPYGAPNWWTGKPLAADLALFQRSIYHELSTWQYAQYIQLEIFDTANPDGVFKAGRGFVGEGIRPEKNASFPVSIGINSLTDESKARDGTLYFHPRNGEIVVPFSFDLLTRIEGHKVLELTARNDKHREAVLVWDAADPAYAYMKTVLGRLSKLDQLKFTTPNRNAMSLQIEGLTW